MDPLSMEKAMLKNMIEKTGKPILEWIDIVIFLKEGYLLGHFYAHLIARKSK